MTGKDYTQQLLLYVCLFLFATFMHDFGRLIREIGCLNTFEFSMHLALLCRFDKSYTNTSVEFWGLLTHTINIRNI